MTFQSPPRRRNLLLLPIATLFVAAAGTFIIYIFTNDTPYLSSLRHQNHHQRQLSLTSGALSQFSDPKSTEIRSVEEARRNCQIIYFMGVEGVSVSFNICCVIYE